MADSTDLPPLGLMDLMPLAGMVVGIIVVLLYGLGILGGSPAPVLADKDGKPQRCESCCGYDAGRGETQCGAELLAWAGGARRRAVAQPGTCIIRTTSKNR